MNAPDWNEIIDDILGVLETETSSQDLEHELEETTQQ